MINEQRYVKIAGCGTYLPNEPVGIDEIDDVLGKLDKAPQRIIRWYENMRSVMKELLEVKYYHYAIDRQTHAFTDDNLTMSVKAAKLALADAHMSPEQVELIVYGGPYLYQMPCLSVRIQEALGIEQVAELSIQANCTSAYKALAMGADLIEVGKYRNALIISSNMPSSQFCAGHYHQEIIEKEDIFLRWYLCDGAGAVVLKAAETEENGFFLKNTYMESVGGFKPSAMHTNWPAYFMNPMEVYQKGYHHLKQMFQNQLKNHFHDADGSVFFKGLKRMLAKYPVDMAKLKILQINMPSKHVVDFIMDECSTLGIEKHHMYSPIGEMGYVGPPAALISLDKLIKEKTFADQDLILSFVTEVSKFMQAGYIVQYLQ